MEKGRPSHTAKVSALMRAAHPLIDSPPWIFEDPYAAALIGLHTEAAVRAELTAFEQELARLASPALARTWIRVARLSGALRARFFEDELDAALGRGVAQYVILGAGYDSFAYRRPDLLHTLHVFELDHPDTQDSKQARLRELGVPIPPNVTFVPIDFEARHSILDALQAKGYQPGQAAYFCWPGVVWYLTDEAIDRTLWEVTCAASNSELALDYVVPDELLPEEEREVLRVLQVMAASRGESGGKRFAPADLAQKLAAFGFTDLVDLSADAATARYCADRSDGLRIPQLLRVVKARTNGTQSQPIPGV
jgi:methyltransferase (TIGR00027 family)